MNLILSSADNVTKMFLYLFTALFIFKNSLSYFFANFEPETRHRSKKRLPPTIALWLACTF